MWVRRIYVTINSYKDYINLYRNSTNITPVYPNTDNKQKNGDKNVTDPTPQVGEHLSKNTKNNPEALSDQLSECKSVESDDTAKEKILLDQSLPLELKNLKININNLIKLKNALTELCKDKTHQKIEQKIKDIERCCKDSNDSLNRILQLSEQKQKKCIKYTSKVIDKYIEWADKKLGKLRS